MYLKIHLLRNHGGITYRHPALVCFDTGAKLELRPLNANPDNPNDLWELALFYTEARGFNPNPGSSSYQKNEPAWVGSYHNIFTGARVDCESHFDIICNSVEFIEIPASPI